MSQMRWETGAQFIVRTFAYSVAADFRIFRIFRYPLDHSLPGSRTWVGSALPNRVLYQNIQ